MPQAGLAEPRRREFLAALGVPLFRARQPLPGAAPSWPEPVSADPVPSRSEPAIREATRPSVMPPPAAPVHEPVRLTTPPPSMPPPVASLQAEPPGTDPVFACRLLQVGSDLAVLLDLGPYPDLGPREAQLWQALCQAFDWQPVALAADFSWPVTGATARTGLIGRDADSARAMLAGWLGRDLTAGHRLLVLGEGLAEFVSRPHRGLPGLADLLASPLAKRLLWQTLSQDARDA